MQLDFCTNMNNLSQGNTQSVLCYVIQHIYWDNPECYSQSQNSFPSDPGKTVKVTSTYLTLFTTKIKPNALFAIFHKDIRIKSFSQIMFNSSWLPALFLGFPGLSCLSVNVWACLDLSVPVFFCLCLLNV